jgi:hypothetical protein
MKNKSRRETIPVEPRQLMQEWDDSSVTRSLDYSPAECAHNSTVWPALSTARKTLDRKRMDMHSRSGITTHTPSRHTVVEPAFCSSVVLAAWRGDKLQQNHATWYQRFMNF